MPTRRHDFRAGFGARILLLLALTVPSALAASVVSPASGITAEITASKGSFTTSNHLIATEPVALALLGSGLLSVAFLIRRLQS
jgi:hypothetical protein